MPIAFRRRVAARYFAFRESRARAAREAQLRERDRRLVDSITPDRPGRLNIGSSSEFVDGWINADLVRDPAGRCLVMDATEPWPFLPSSLEAVNSEHFIEHVPKDAGRRFLEEAFRALRPGGVIRTSTPDLRALCATYVDADPADLAAHRAHGYQAESHADLVNNYLYVPGHTYIYDEQTLRSLLSECGFVQIEQALFGGSRHHVLRGIDRHDMGELRHIVICLDAVKP
jgi:predicted SAM-dependent methyltransferase